MNILYRYGKNSAWVKKKEVFEALFYIAGLNGGGEDVD